MMKKYVMIIAALFLLGACDCVMGGKYEMRLDDGTIVDHAQFESTPTWPGYYCFNGVLYMNNTRNRLTLLRRSDDSPQKCVIIKLNEEE